MTRDYLIRQGNTQLAVPWPDNTLDKTLVVNVEHKLMLDGSHIAHSIPNRELITINLSKLRLYERNQLETMLFNSLGNTFQIMNFDGNGFTTVKLTNDPLYEHYGDYYCKRTCTNIPLFKVTINAQIVS